MSATRLYYHPDGAGTITHAPDALICTDEWNDITVRIVIGPDCLIELGRALIALGESLGGEVVA